MIILYAYDANAILVGIHKSRSGPEILRVYDVLYDTLETAGHAQN